MTTSKSKKIMSPEEIDHELDKALEEPASSVKVPISLRLDGDVYDELHRRAEAGEASGKYQKLLNQILRESLFDGTNRTVRYIGTTKSNKSRMKDSLHDRKKAQTFSSTPASFFASFEAKNAKPDPHLPMLQVMDSYAMSHPGFVERIVEKVANFLNKDTSAAVLKTQAYSRKR